MSITVCEPVRTCEQVHNVTQTACNPSERERVELQERLGRLETSAQAGGDVPGPAAGNRSERAFAWLVITAASATLFVGVGYANTFGVFQDYYQTSLFPDEPADKLIIIGSIASSLYLVLGIFTGRLADLVGYRISIALGSALMVGGLFAASASRTYWQLLLTQGLMFGLGAALVYAPTTTISRQYFPGHRHGLVNSIVISGGALGGCVLPYSVRQLIAAYGLPATFRILGYLALAILTPSALVMRPKAQENTPRGRQPLLDLALLSNPSFIVLLLACTVAMTGFLPRYFLIPSSAIAAGIESSYASWLLGIMNGLSIVGRVGIGYLADRFGKVQALSASFVLCGLGHFAFWLPGVAVSADDADVPTALFTLFVVYIGIFGSGFISLFPVVVAHLFGKDRLASKTGLLNTACGLSTFAGPSAVYAIVGDGMGVRWTVAVLIAGFFMFGGGLILGFGSAAIDRTKERRQQAVRD